MKVNGPNGPNGPAALRSYQGGKQATKSGGTEREQSADRVDVSSGAQVLANARAPQEPDMERIQRIKDAIANGTFVIDHERIAQKMLDEEQ